MCLTFTKGSDGLDRRTLHTVVMPRLNTLEGVAEDTGIGTETSQFSLVL